MKISAYSCRCRVGGPPPGGTVTSRTSSLPEVSPPEALIVVTSVTTSQCSPSSDLVTWTVSMSSSSLSWCGRYVPNDSPGRLPRVWQELVILVRKMVHLRDAPEEES